MGVITEIERQKYFAYLDGVADGLNKSMTNQEKFIQMFGIDAWQQMIVFSGLAEQFKEYWTSSYKAESKDNNEL